MKRAWIISTVVVLVLAAGTVFLRVRTLAEIGRIEGLQGRTGAFPELAKAIGADYQKLTYPWQLEKARTNLGLSTVSNLLVVRFQGEGLPYFDGYAASDTNNRVVRAVVVRRPEETRVPRIVVMAIYYAAEGLLLYAVLCVLSAVFWKGMRRWMARHRVAHACCFLFVIYALSGWRFWYTHTTGGSYIVTHARTTIAERWLVGAFRPFFIFILGFRILPEPVAWDVGFHDMRPVPTASITASGFVLHLGSVTNPSFSKYNLHPDNYQQDANAVYIYCRMNGRGTDQREFDVECPPINGQKFDPQSVKLIWKDPDGAEIPIPLVR